MAIDKIPAKCGPLYRSRVLLSNGKRKSKCFRRKADAELWEAKIKSTRSEEQLIERQRIRFYELAELFIENHAKTGLAVSSCQRYEEALKLHIIPEFDKCWIDEITKLQVAKFKAKLEEKNLAQSSKNFLFTAFKTVMRKAQEWDLLDKNPAEGIKPPRKGMSRTEYWTASEVNQFLDANRDSRFLSLYLIALNTGMRVGEILGLKWDCVDLESGFITVRRIFCQKSNQVKETTKTKRARQIGINSTLHSLLLKMKLNGTSEFVFDLQIFGAKKASHVSRILKEDCLRAGVKVIKFHDLRHTFATQFVMNNGSIHSLSGMLGHTGITMTSRYAHYGPEHAKKAAQVVSFDVPETASVLHFDLKREKKWS